MCVLRVDYHRGRVLGAELTRSKVISFKWSVIVQGAQSSESIQKQVFLFPLHQFRSGLTADETHLGHLNLDTFVGHYSGKSGLDWTPSKILLKEGPAEDPTKSCSRLFSYDSV